MEILTKFGPGYQSGLLDLARAEELVRTLSPDPRWSKVYLHESRRAAAHRPGARYRVLCVVASETLQQRMLDGFQALRVGKARIEGDRYLWAPDPDRPFWHLQSASREHYEVDNFGHTCTCPDFTDACDPNGLQCKHLIAFREGWGTWLDAGEWDRSPFAPARFERPDADEDGVIIERSAA